jgi:dipeptidyl aminopeptidase/acylaminoacyl peptidase
MNDADPTVAQARARPAPEQISRRAFFSYPARTAPAISPDGAHLAFLAPHEGVLNVWVGPTGAVDQARPLSAATGRPVTDFFWSPDSSRVLYRQDTGGTENFLLYGVALSDRQTVAYTPFAKTQVNVIRVSPQVRDAVLIGLNNRDPRWHDTYRLDVATGELTLVWQNPGGYSRVVADRELNLVLAQRVLPGGGAQVERFGEDGVLTPLFAIGLDDSLSTAVLSAVDPHRLYLLDSRGRDTAALSIMDAATGETRVLAEDAQVDVGGSIKNPATGEIEAYSVEYLTRRWVGLTPEMTRDIAAIDAQAGGGWLVTSQSDDNRFWTIAVDRVTEAPFFYLYDREAKALTRLFASRPDLDGKALAPMHPREIKARDGLTLVSFLSLPPSSDADGDGVPDHPVPMVLLVHGGPWGRDVLGFDSTHQWLANRGYAVLSVNYRSSTGFGKAFISAGDLEWGRAMHHDLLDSVDWAVRAGVTSADMVCIMGGSYGGYATLVGVAMTPDVFRCGVEIVGPSNLVTLLETVPPYWGAIYEQFAQRMGDPRTEDGRALLRERSPVNYAQQIKVPLLIGQGANDARVNKRESDQIVAAMKAHGVPVTYVLYPDEGHGFRRPENNTAFNAVTEGFLATCLGGAAEPIGGDFQGSSIQVLEGADLVDGLAAALPDAQAG